MKLLFILIFFLSLGHAAKQEIYFWKSGQTYLNFLQSHNLPLHTLYYNLDGEDQALTEEIFSGTRCELLVDDNQTLLQALIPINDALQLQIYQQADKSYAFATTPLILEEQKISFMFKIKTSPYSDIMDHTKNRLLAQEFILAYKNSLNFKTQLRKGDRIAIVYKQNYRNGYRIGYPQIEVAMVEIRGKFQYIYRNNNDRYYNKDGKQIEGFKLKLAIRKGRITSYFSKRRFHPILKRYRAHIGIDFAARSGTPIHAAASGRIIFKGQSRGYGNFIKIRHQDGYVTLYAHLKSFKRNIKQGDWINQGKIIGYVGSTGMSTGPHLHFGLYKNGQSRNPLGVLQIATSMLKGRQLRAFNVLKNIYNKEIALVLKNSSKPKIFKEPDNICYLGANNLIENAKED